MNVTRAELLAVGFASVGDDVRIDASVRWFGADRIHLGSHVRIDAYAVLSAGVGGLRVGDYVHIGPFCFFTGAAPIEVHDFAQVSARVSVYSSSGDFDGDRLDHVCVPGHTDHTDDAPVTIGRHAMIGGGCVVLPGVTIEDGGAVGALSVVRERVPAFTIVAGAPARVLRERGRGALEGERAYLETLSDPPSG